MEENDEISDHIDDYTTAVLQAVMTTNVPRLKKLLERDPDLINCVDPATGNSLLHLAVLHGGYNAAVHLLNRGCSTAHRNVHGLTAVQLARRLPECGAIAVAIALTEQKRHECDLADLRARARAANISALTNRTTGLSGPLATLHQLTLRNLEAARGTLARLEAEMAAAKALVQSLEHQLILIESAAQLADLQQQSSDSGGESSAGIDLEHARCGVCLELPGGKIFQCNQGITKIPATFFWVNLDFPKCRPNFECK
jgi:Ankyrin repeats (many copies)